MNPQLQEALDALEKADAAGNVEDAKELADYIRQLQAQEESSSGDMIYPAAGAAIGSTFGAVAGPAVGSAVDTAATKVAEKVAGPKGTQRGDKVAKWLATQTTGPNAGGATFEEAYKKSEIARGKPVQSRGSQIPIRKGFLGIENQPAEPSLPQKTAANIISSERLGKPSVARRIGGMGVMGAEAGKTISDIEKGDTGEAILSGIGTVGGALSQSRIKPLRAIGTGLSLLVPTVQGGKEVKDIFYPSKEEEEKKAAGGLVHLAEGGKLGKAKSVTKKLSEVLIPREGQTLLGTMADRTKATGGFSGGPGFINLHPEYTWAMDSPGAANRLLNAVNQAGGSNRAVVSPMLMSTTAHRSNRPVFEKMYFELLEDIIGNHIISDDVPDAVSDRAVIVKPLKMFEIECVARGYLTGSGLKEYQADKKVCGIGLPNGLVDGSQLPTPIFTPATKAAIGDHDINIDFDSAAAIVGLAHAEALRENTLKLYATAAEFASSRGIILADTKFEFGLDNNGEIILGDEALTPDSSRFWDTTNPGTSFDKQFVRDYLTSSGWDKKSPPPELPAEIIEKTAQRYHQAYYTITGSKF